MSLYTVCPPQKKCTCTRVCARLCNRAETSLPWKLLRTYLESCASIVQAAVCRPPRYWLANSVAHPSVRSGAAPPLNDVHSRNHPKSTPAHNSVAAAVSHKHHSIICVGAGLIQFVHGRTCGAAAKVIPKEFLFPPFFPASFEGRHFLFVVIYYTTTTVSIRCTHISRINLHIFNIILHQCIGGGTVYANQSHYKHMFSRGRKHQKNHKKNHANSLSDVV